MYAHYNTTLQWIATKMNDWMNPASSGYYIISGLMIFFFSYFWVATMFQPSQIAEDLKRNGGYIPGIRPGKPTSDFIARVISKVTLVGAIFLGIIAIFPIVFSAITKANVSLGGTSILIIVGVALETMRQMESQMMMRHHKGFLE